MSDASKDPSKAGLSPMADWEDDGGAEVSPIVAAAVGQALQAHFQAIAEMPLPDRLLVLLAELEASERRQ